MIEQLIALWYAIMAEGRIGIVRKVHEKTFHACVRNSKALKRNPIAAIWDTGALDHS